MYISSLFAKSAISFEINCISESFAPKHFAGMNPNSQPNVPSIVMLAAILLVASLNHPFISQITTIKDRPKICLSMACFTLNLALHRHIYCTAQPEIIKPAVANMITKIEFIFSPFKKMIDPVTH